MGDLEYKSESEEVDEEDMSDYEEYKFKEVDDLIYFEELEGSLDSEEVEDTFFFDEARNKSPRVYEDTPEENDNGLSNDDEDKIEEDDEVIKDKSEKGDKGKAEEGDEDLSDYDEDSIEEDLMPEMANESIGDLWSEHGETIVTRNPGQVFFQ